MEREVILEGKTERQKLEIRAYLALADLSHFFEEAENPLFYQVNHLIRDLDAIREMNQRREYDRTGI